MRDVRIGQSLTYDDGRPNHHVKARVIDIIDNGFVAQFEDRYSPTTIMWNEPEWMRYITFDEHSC